MPLNQWSFKKNMNVDYSSLGANTLKLLNLSHARLYNNLIVLIESELSSLSRSYDYFIKENM